MTEWPRIWRWGDPVEPLVEVLEGGGLLAIPTESSYGLAVDPRSAAGVAGVYRLKERPAVKPLPVVLSEREQLGELGGDPEARGFKELARLWPAPLTVVVPIDRPLPASAGQRTLAVRVPAHERLLDLLRRLDRPLTATSANPSGSGPVASCKALRSLLTGWPSVIIDDGDLPGGAPSTIVDICGEELRVLREGALEVAVLEELLSKPVFSAATAEIPADDSRDAR